MKCQNCEKLNIDSFVSFSQDHLAALADPANVELPETPDLRVHRVHLALLAPPDPRATAVNLV